MSGLKDFGRDVAAGIEANVGIANDAAVSGEDFRAGVDGLWEVKATVNDEGLPVIIVTIWAG